MAPWIVPAIAGAASIIGGIINRGAQRRQSKENWKLAQFQADANQRYLDAQLQYNTPKNQMVRWQEAGLNPHLAYGQGNPGNQSAPLNYPEIGKTDYQGGAAQMAQALMTMGPLMNQSMMTASQVQATDAKTNKTYVETQLAQLQKQVTERNPLLNDAAFKAIIDGLISTARIKASDATVKTEYADWFSGEKSFMVDGKPMHGPAGVVKLETELKALEQRYRLGELDANLKAEVLKSKEFQNALQEIQVKWMKDADITPQHVYQFIQMLLLKLL